MSFPADGIESAYKNNIDDVRDFLEAKYPENYLVVNVSPRTYRTEKLGDRVCVYILVMQCFRVAYHGISHKSHTSL